MRIHMEDGSTVDVPKVRPIASLLALGTCTICELSFGDGQAIADHAGVPCSEVSRDGNRGKIRVTLFGLADALRATP